MSHRALMLGLLAEGTTSIHGISDGADVRSTAAVVQALGARVDEYLYEDGMRVEVTSPGIDGLRTPEAVLDCGNSGTTLRLFSGILAGQPYESRLDGDASLRSRPVARIVQPLRAMGAEVSARAEDTLPPVTIRGRRDLDAIEWTPSVPSAQVKSAILFAGLRAAGTTRVHESVATRDHTERMLRAHGVDVRTLEGPAGWTVEVDGGQRVIARDETVWGDPSAAAFWLVASAIHPDADLVLARIDLNPRRRAAINMLTAMGGSIEVLDPEPIVVVADVASLRVRSSELQAVDVPPAETAAAIDEIPVLCLAATQAHGRSVIRGAGELRHKESDRISGIVAGLSALGARIEAVADDIVIQGPTPLRGAVVDSRSDHRLAMTLAIAGLIAAGTTTILNADSVAISYPTFFADLERIRS